MVNLFLNSLSCKCSLRDPNFNLTDFISDMKIQLWSWRKVFWRLWGLCSNLYCIKCESEFQVCRRFEIVQRSFYWYFPGDSAGDLSLPPVRPGVPEGPAEEHQPPPGGLPLLWQTGLQVLPDPGGERSVGCWSAVMLVLRCPRDVTSPTTPSA